jgi:hypothetical protein
MPIVLEPKGCNPQRTAFEQEVVLSTLNRALHQTRILEHANVFRDRGQRYLETAGEVGHLGAVSTAAAELTDQLAPDPMRQGSVDRVELASTLIFNHMVEQSYHRPGATRLPCKLRPLYPPRAVSIGLASVRRERTYM